MIDAKRLVIRAQGSLINMKQLGNQIFNLLIQFGKSIKCIFIFFIKKCNKIKVLRLYT